MKKVIIVFLTLFLNLFFFPLFGQLINIEGRAINSEDNSSIVGALISIDKNVYMSNQNGDFKIKTTPGKKNIVIRAIGIKQKEITINVYSDTAFIIRLEVEPVKMKEVTILADSVKSIERSPNGNFTITRAGMRETPRYFSEPDLVRSLQSLPGVLPGKDGTTDFFVRGGSPGQNIFLANGCSFFIPSHLLGLSSSFDLDFIDKTELVKDYFPSDLGGGASSIIKIDYRIPKVDSLGIKLRAGLLTSGLTFQIPLKQLKIGITGGIKYGNYSFYAPLLKSLMDKTISDFLPPNNYSFYDSYLRLIHSSPRAGTISYVFMKNRDSGSKLDITDIIKGDTTIRSGSGFVSSWSNIVHSIEWILPSKGKTRWIYDLNFNELSIQKENFLKSDKYIHGNTSFYSKLNSFQFSPSISNIGSKIYFNRKGETIGFSGGMYYRFRNFSPNALATDIMNDEIIVKKLINGYTLHEPAAFISSEISLTADWTVEGGIRISSGLTKENSFISFEPRIRLTHEKNKRFSQHLNYVRLSQFDHSIESSNVGLRSMLWIPILNDFAPEISDIYSFGLNGQFKNYMWSFDLYMKYMDNMVDFKPGASFLYASSITDLLDKINGKAYGLEVFIVKKMGIINGNLTYTYSRSKREWFAPEGMFWIPSAADRPHNINISLKYYWKSKTSLGLNWVYSSGLPATMYTHSTSYEKWFETKNNIRYPDYHRLDISIRRIFKIRRTLINFDFDVSNVYNRKNTFYLKEEYDSINKLTRYKNISLFPLMPSFSLSIQNSWSLKRPTRYP